MQVPFVNLCVIALHPQAHVVVLVDFLQNPCAPSPRQSESFTQSPVSTHL